MRRDTVRKELSEERRKELLTPGIHPENAKYTDLRPCGKCDGVIFLGARWKHEWVKGESVPVALVASKEEQALRYLRQMPVEWLALRGNKEIGVSMPDVAYMYSEEMIAEATAAGVGLERIFTCDEHCINAARPEHAVRFKVHKVEEGVWAVIYV